MRRLIPLVALASIVALQLSRSHASPGDVVTSQAPVLGGDPPKPRDVKDGDFSVSDTGAGTYAYELDVPPGRQGMQPTVALRYSSQGAIRGGLAVGWTLDFPAIRLDTTEGRLAGEVHYTSTMSGGQRLVPTAEPVSVAGAVAYRAEQDSSYTRYERLSTGRWIARTTDGKTWYFGESSGSTDGGVSVWQLTRVVDPWGNTVQYFWSNVSDAGGVIDVALDTIEYTSNGGAGLAAHARVRFVYAAALETCTPSAVPVGAALEYRSGQRRMPGARKLQEIHVDVRPTPGATWQLRRSLLLSYKPSASSCSAPHAPLRILQNLRMTPYAPDGVASSSQSISFGYGPEMPTLATPKTNTYGGSAGILNFGSGRRRADTRQSYPTIDKMLLDIDGDGRPDHLRMSTTADPRDCVVEWRRNRGDGWTTGGTFTLPRIPWAETPPTSPYEEGCSLAGQLTYRQNLVPPILPGGPPPPPLDCTSSIAEPGGPPPACATCNDTTVDPLGTYHGYRFLDVNGDGLPDLVTAIQYDPYYYDPNADPALDAASPPPPCEVEPGPDDCVDPRTGVRGDCGVFYMAGAADCEDGIRDFDYRESQRRCGGYLWRIYWNTGNGAFDPTPTFRYSPIPLEANGADTALGGKASSMAGQYHGMNDLDGDGFIDAFITCLFDGTECMALGTLGEGAEAAAGLAWQVFRGDGTGRFRGTGGGAYLWTTPRPLAISVSHSGPIDPDHRFSQSISGLTDVNGDDLPDYVGVDAGTLVAYFNTGTGFATTATPLTGVWSNASRSYIDILDQSPMEIFEANRLFNRREVDLDGDRLVDIAALPSGTSMDGSYTLYRNLGDRLVAAPSALPDWDDAVARLVKINQNSWVVDDDLVDLDGDGRLDLATFEAGTLTLKGEPADGQAPRLLRTIDNHQGLVITIDYAASTDPAAVGFGGTRAPQPTWVVTGVREDAGFGTPAGTTTYRYKRPVYNQDRRGRFGFRGFEEVISTAPLGARTVKTYAFAPDYSGRIVETITFAGASDATAARISETTWEEKLLFGGTVRAYHPSEERTWLCDDAETEAACRAAGGNFRRVTTTWEAYNYVVGGVSQPVAYVRAIDDEGLSATEAEGDRVVLRVYRVTYTPSAYWVQDQDKWSAEKNAWLGYEYYGAEQIEYDANGLPIRTSASVDGVIAVTTERTFDAATGNVTSVTSPRRVATGSGPQETYGYDAHRLFIESTTNALSQTSWVWRDVATGVVTKRRGPNTKFTCWPCTIKYDDDDVFKIDGYGRVLERQTTIDVGPGYVLSLVERNTYYDTALPNRVKNERRSDFGGAIWVTIETSVDGAGRVISEQKFRSTDGPDAITTFAYDAEGRLASFTIPDPRNDALTITYQYEYDSLGRPTLFTRPDGTTGEELTYGRLDRTRREVTLDGSGSTTVQVYDPRDRLVQVKELVTAPSAYAVTTYGYDAADRLTSILDADGNPTTLAYDWLGRRTSISRGTRTWTYGYDENGNLVSELVPRPPNAVASFYTTTIAYDALDRVSSRLPGRRAMSDDDLSRLGVGLISYTYDAGTNGKGRLTSVTLPFGTVTLGYDARGNVTTETRRFTVAHASLVGASSVTDQRTITRAYNALELETTQVHADGVQSKTSYDRLGQPIKAEWLTGGAWQSLGTLTRSPMGLVRRRDTAYGQHRELTYTLLGQPATDQVWDDAPAPVLRGSWAPSYDDSGDVTALVTHSGTFTFDYDAQHQLVTATGPFGYSAGLWYSDAGRIQSADVTWTPPAGTPPAQPRDVWYDYAGSPDPEAVARLVNVTGGATFASYGYDPAGNVTTRTKGAETWTFRYDGEDQQREVIAPDGTREVYYYDHNGQRVLAIEAGVKVRFWFGEDELSYPVGGAKDGSGNSIPDRKWAHVSLGSQAVARVENGTTLELQYQAGRRDLQLALDASGLVVSDFTYGAFGELLAAGGDVENHHRRFNGKEHDDASGLVYYGFRYYDPLSLQWTQADPLLRFAPELALGKPRGQNLYAFTLNNAIRYLDPDGRWGDEAPKVYQDHAVSDQGQANLEAAVDSVGRALGDAGMAVSQAVFDHTIVGDWMRQGYEAYEQDGNLGVAVFVVGTVIENLGGRGRGRQRANSAPAPKRGAPDVVTANGQRAAADGTRLGPSGRPEYHSSDSSTRKRALDGAAAQGSGQVARDPASSKQPSHFHAVDKKGRRIAGPKKTHWNKRGDKPKKKKPDEDK